MRALIRFFYTMCLVEAENGVNDNDASSSLLVRFFRYKVYTYRKK